MNVHHLNVRPHKLYATMDLYIYLIYILTKPDFDPCTLEWGVLVLPAREQDDVLEKRQGIILRKFVQETVPGRFPVAQGHLLQRPGLPPPLQHPNARFHQLVGVVPV